LIQINRDRSAKAFGGQRRTKEVVMRPFQKMWWTAPATGQWSASVCAALACAFIVAPGAHAQDAATILKAMSDYVTAQKSISISFDSDIEVVTSDLQKIQFTSSGQVLLNRPDKLRVTRTGGYTDVELVFDGKTATLLGKNVNAFAQADAPGTVDQLIDRIRDESNISMPGADLLLSRVYDELTSDVFDAKHIGQGVIDGVDCEHLAFRGAEVDWQLWVETGARPIPRKYVITSKHVTGAPQYTLRVKDWKTDPPASADAFVFKAPADAKKVEFAALHDVDEIPPGQVTGAKK
jgi:hypothetical protein